MTEKTKAGTAMKMLTKNILLSAAAIGVVAGLGVSVLLSSSSVQAQKAGKTRQANAPTIESVKQNETYRFLNLFGDVFERVRAEYVEEVTDQELIEHALKGLLTNLDPHSSYLTEEDYKGMQVQTKGEFGGLGIEVTMESGLVKVVSPIDDTPAFRAGMQAGDMIAEIDGDQVMGLSLSEAVKKCVAASAQKSC